ncbi:MAG: 4-hydroxy-tetrahydrodipicolinate reductase [Reyranellales bacterium]
MTPPPVRQLALLGSTGRMGQSIVQALRQAPQWRLRSAVASKGSARLRQDAALEGEPLGVLVASDVPRALDGATVAMDFSLGGAVAAHADACAAAQVPLLVGVTGLDEAAHQALRRAAQRIAVLVAPNTSVGVGVLMDLAVSAVRSLGPDFDVEILEAHHRGKRDAPSGTALALGEAIATARGHSLAELAEPYGARSAAARVPGSIGFAVLRAGDIVGDHTVIFASAGERLEITHRATDRLTFARGALRAAEWLSLQPAGLYRMENVLRP